jgi:hypothetical protein
VLVGVHQQERVQEGDQEEEQTLNQGNMSRRNDIQKVLVIGSRRVLREISILLALFLCLSASASTTSCTYKKIHVLDVRGHVGNQLLENLPGARVTMRKSGQTVAETTADQNGDFRVKVPRGEYDMIISADGWYPSSTHLNVGFSLTALFHDKPIRVFLTVSPLCINTPRRLGQAIPTTQS